MTDTEREAVELCTIDNCDYPSHWDGDRNPLCAAETEQAAAAGLRVCGGDVCVSALTYAEAGKSPYETAVAWLESAGDVDLNRVRIAVGPDYGWRDIKRDVTDNIAGCTLIEGYVGGLPTVWVEEVAPEYAS